MKKKSVDIAIVGMSCRFPGARNYQEYWENLINNVNSISEIPADRWDWRDYYGNPESKASKTNVKWGGFIQDIDKFDPLFFKISPTEASYIDPQHRIFLESAWHAIEDAGYNPRSLAGKKIGVYVGVSKNDYAELMRENKESVVSFVSTGTVHSIIANRASYLLDFVGKSEVVDTACSSFMVALNNAARDISLGICESAVVGGVNAIITPTMYLSHSKSGMLSADGVCRSFDESANGYVRGEGIGVVYLKPLGKAQQDGDDIWGVIKGIAVAHGGKSNFLTAPKASSQASVISEAIKNAAVSPDSVSYIEAHGTGTPLGDPIEIEALNKAYNLSTDKNRTAISAVKTNIGHLESAAGAAGLIKILLAFKHKMIPATLNFNRLNPYIKLDNSHFYIANKNVSWSPVNENGEMLPLRAGLSAFGMGGVNAHAIFEGPPVNVQVMRSSSKGVLVPVSAKSQPQLEEYVQSILSYIAKNDDVDLARLSYTLMYGREAMTSRAVFCVDNLESLKDAMKAFLEGAPNDHIVKIDGVKVFDNQSSLKKEACDWLLGQSDAWEPVLSSPGIKHMHLPGYPFKKTRCWFPGAITEAVPPKPEKSAQTKSRDTNLLAVDDYFVRDHVVKGENIVPGVKYLDLLLKNAENKTASEVNEIKDVFWVRPIKVVDDVNVQVEFLENQQDIELSIKVEDTIYCTGKAAAKKRQQGQKSLNIESIMKRCNQSVSSSDIYTLFKENGLDYGDTFRVIQKCKFNQDEIICELKRSSTVLSNDVIESSMADGVFQTVAALYLLNDTEKRKQLLPYYLKKLKIYEPIPDQCFAYVKRNVNSKEAHLEAYDMYIVKSSGEIVAEFKEFIKRIYKKNTKVEDKSVKLLSYKATWIKRELGMHGENIKNVLVFDNGKVFLNKLRRKLEGAFIIQVKAGNRFEKLGNNLYQINPNDVGSYYQLWRVLNENNIKVDSLIYAWNFLVNQSVEQAIALGIKSIFRLVQSLILSKNNTSARILYLFHRDHSAESCLNAMIAGFSRTLAYENPNLLLTSVAVDDMNESEWANIAYDELSTYNNAPLNELSYEHGIRKAKVIVPSTMQNDHQILLNNNANYLITGGLGGLGFVFAQYLAKTYQANLILVGRSALDSARERKLNELSDLGVNAQYIQADIANEAALATISSILEEKNIQLNGVIHCAGLIDDAFIIKKTDKSFDTVIASKTYGAIHLDQLTKNHALDFFMVFSSIASIMPNQGQSDYASANSFLDEFVNCRAHMASLGERSGKSIAINWPLWKNGGIGVNQEEEEHLKNVFGMLPLETDLGIDIFVKSLSASAINSAEQIIAIEGDQDKIEKHLQVFNDVQDVSEVSVLDYLKNIIQKTLNLTLPVDINENLFEMGLNSVGSVKLVETLNKVFNIDLEPTIFFEYNSISKLSDYLENDLDMKVQDSVVYNYREKSALIDVERSSPANLSFIKDFSRTEYFMKDHVVDGKYNVPGACYIEMAAQCGEMISADRRVYKLTNNYWAKQLSTMGDAVDARLKFQEKNGYYEYEVTSDVDGKNTLHALGQLYLADMSKDKSLGKINFDDIASRCSIKRAPDEIYQFIHAEGLHVGPSFMPMLEIVLSEKEALSHLKLPDFVSKTTDDYIFHPSLLTGVLQAALLNNKPFGMDDSQFIPIGIDEIVFTDKMPVECYVYTRARKLSGSSNDIVKFDAQISDVNGNIIASILGLTLRNLTASKSTSSKLKVKQTKNLNEADVSSEQFNLHFENKLKEILAESIGLPPSEIESTVDLEAYGINSVMIVDLNRALSEIFGNLSKTLFFEYKSIKELAGYFFEHHKAVLREMLGLDDEVSKLSKHSSESEVGLKTENSHLDDTQDTIIEDVNQKAESIRSDDIAIVGVSGRYPEAENLEEFWDNLKQGKDSITEMPKWRFDYEKFYKINKDKSLLSAQWGGFLGDVDKFDPQFFNISPKVADLMDPQERLFLEVAWETVESAGYSQDTLCGRSIGVFVGALWQSYNALAIEETIKGNIQSPDGLLYNIPNRVSFFFDWSGPSLAIDTACSGSLSALHFACESVRRGDCEAALVGGVNISFSSDKYLWLTKNNFLSSDGKCRSFGADGDGYVPGEGVGAVYIKKLSDAIKDGDNILAVIKGTSVNHGGKTNGYTVPNPNKQAELIMQSIEKSGVAADKINYIEAHGTGTSLGDPIEIAGITKAFSSYKATGHACAIGSVKSNIGHLEAAAGIAGLTKILLQMKYKTLVPSLHSEKFNPNIDFEHSFLTVQRGLAPWQHCQDDSGRLEPYRAMLSSFGAGGSNAHAILEEYMPVENKARVTVEDEIQTIILPISASDKTQLKIYVNRLLSFLEKRIDEEMRSKDYQQVSSYLRDLAYTFQVARREMNERLIIIANNIKDLKNKLQQYLLGNNDKNIYSVNIKESKKTLKLLSNDSQLQSIFDEWVINKNTHKIAELWLVGMAVNWQLFYGSMQVKRIDTVNYPFKKERYWIKQIESIGVTEKIEKLHPLLHKNTADFFEQRYTSVFDATDPLLIRKENGEYTLPSLLALEMAQESVFQATNNRKNHWSIKNIRWEKAVTVSSVPLVLNIRLDVSESDEGSVKEVFFEQYSDASEQPSEKQLYASGSLRRLGKVEEKSLDIAALKEKIKVEAINQEAYHEILDEHLNPHLAYNVVEALNCSAKRCLAKINLEKMSSLSGFTLQPALLVSVGNILSLAGIKGGLLSQAELDNKVAIQSLDEVFIYSSTEKVSYCYVEKTGGSISQYDVYLCDTEGRILVKMFGLKFYHSSVVEDLKKKSASNLMLETPKKSSSLDLDQDVEHEKVSAIKVEATNQKSKVGYDAVKDFLVDSLSFALNISAADIEAEKPFVDMGMDSISAVEWIDAIKEKYACPVSETKIYDYPNLDEFSRYVYSLLDGSKQEDSFFDVELENEERKDDQSIQSFLLESLSKILGVSSAEIDINEPLGKMNLSPIDELDWLEAMSQQYDADIDEEILSLDKTIAELSHAVTAEIEFGSKAKPAEEIDNIAYFDPSGECKVARKNSKFNDSDAVQGFLVSSLAFSLRMSEDDIELNKPFVDMGLDSISAVEWVDAINEKYGASIKETKIYDYPNLEEFIRYFLKEVSANHSAHGVILEQSNA